MRFTDPAVIDALARDRLSVGLLAEFDFGADQGDDRFWRFWDGFRHVVTADGRVFVGAAAFARYEGQAGGSGLAALPRQIILDGARWRRAAEAAAAEAGGLEPVDPAAALRSIGDLPYRNKTVTFELRLVDLDTRAELGLARLDRVFIDTVRYRRDPKGGAHEGQLIIACETRARYYNRGTGRTFTHEDQMELTDGTDTFFEYQVTSLEREKRHKGGDAVGTGGGGGGAGAGGNPYINPYFDGRVSIGPIRP